MDAPKRALPSSEPLGIVISEGKREETPPRFRAYIWGAAPEVASTEEQKAA